MLILVSGPSGSGKDYLLNSLTQADERYQIVQMCTTRESRGEGDKPHVSSEQMQDLHQQGSLIGYHTNELGIDYAYKLDDILQAIQSGRDVILEINPVSQKDIIHELAQHSIIPEGWICLLPEINYVATNIILRKFDPQTRYNSEPTIERIRELANINDPVDNILELGEKAIGSDFQLRIQQTQTFFQAINQLKAEGKVTTFSVGWNNRQTMADQFHAAIESCRNNSTGERTAH